MPRIKFIFAFSSVTLTPEKKGFILSKLVEKIYPLIENGSIRPLIHAVLPMTEAQKAHEILQSQTNMGKVVLTLE